jgi:hypothetical protein
MAARAMDRPPEELVRVTLGVTDPSLDDEEREDIARELHRQLGSADLPLAEVSRPRADHVPAGAKSAAATLVGLVTAVLSASGLGAFFSYLSERARGREMAIEVTANGRTIKLTARTQEELVLAYNAVMGLLAERR